MKQHITQEQYEELSSNARMAWIAWTQQKVNERKDYTNTYRSIGHFIEFIKDYANTYRSIGHLIEFIDEHMKTIDGWWSIQCSDGREWRIASKYGPDTESYEFPELCDALWNTIKMILERE